MRFIIIFRNKYVIEFDVLVHEPKLMQMAQSLGY
jgi:hypothetical protein